MKITFNLLFFSALIFLTIIGCKKEDESIPPAPQILEIGDNYAGGIIFFIDDKRENGLICKALPIWQIFKWDEAMDFADDFEHEGFDDWRMPNDLEYSEMFNKLHLKGLGHFNDGRQWTSTEISPSVVWVFDFANGLKSPQNKNQFITLFRPVRSFKL